MQTITFRCDVCEKVFHATEKPEHVEPMQHVTKLKATINSADHVSCGRITTTLNEGLPGAPPNADSSIDVCSRGCAVTAVERSAARMIALLHTQIDQVQARLAIVFKGR